MGAEADQKLMSYLQTLHALHKAMPLTALQKIKNPRC